MIDAVAAALVELGFFEKLADLYAPHEAVAGADPGLIDAVAAALVELGFFVKLADLYAPQEAVAGAPSNDASAWEAVRGVPSSNDVSLVYHSQKHADQILWSWLDLAAAQANSAAPQNAAVQDSAVSSAASQLLAGLTQPQATGRCIKCHTVVPTADHFAVNWRPRERTPDGFTRFAHSPHVTLLNREGQVRSVEPFGDRRCESCHHVQRDHLDFLTTRQPIPGGTVRSPHAAANSVEPMSLSTCIECHTPQAAGNDCLQCHNYHVRGAGKL